MCLSIGHFNEGPNVGGLFTCEPKVTEHHASGQSQGLEEAKLCYDGL